MYKTTQTHTERPSGIGIAVGYDDCWFDGKEYHPYKEDEGKPRLFRVEQMLQSNDPRIWRPLRY